MGSISSFDSRDGSTVFIGRIENRVTGSSSELKRSSVYSTSVYGANAILNNPTGYSGAAIMSIDGLLRPVSMNGLEGLPRFGSYSSQCYLMGTKGSLTPVYTGATGTGNQIYNLNISQNYLRPLTNPIGYGLSFSDRHELLEQAGEGKGHDIELVGHPYASAGTDANYSMVTSLGNGSGLESYSNDYKFLALKGPLIIQGWGYDTNGKPIPNKVDTYSNSIQGIYSSTGLYDYFLPNFLQKSETWPVGPVDLRWDRSRGVWTVPGISEIIVGQSTGVMVGGTTGRVKASGTYYDSRGNLVQGYFPITLDQTACLNSGQDALYYFNPNSCTYSLIGNNSFSITASSCVTGTMNTTFSSFNRLIIGDGLLYGITGGIASTGSGHQGTPGTALILDSNNQVKKSLSTCVGTGDITSYRKFTKIDIHRGLGANMEPNSCTLGIGLALPVYNYSGSFPGSQGLINDRVAELVLGEGLTGIPVSNGRCNALSINMNYYGAGTGGPWVLYDIYCLSGSIYGRYLKHAFNAYGQYTGYVTGVP